MIFDSIACLKELELIEAYSTILSELKKRGVIRSGNLVGDLGEYLAVDYYKKTKGLRKLQLQRVGTQNIDATDDKGNRYSIKTTTTKTTGVFYGFEPPGSNNIDTKKFEYVLVVILDKEYRLLRINELTHDDFMKFKRWHSRMSAWNINITDELLINAKTTYKRDA